jgi:hypothetical protein
MPRDASRCLEIPRDAYLEVSREASRHLEANLRVKHLCRFLCVIFSDPRRSIWRRSGVISLNARPTSALRSLSAGLEARRPCSGRWMAPRGVPGRAAASERERRRLGPRGRGGERQRPSKRGAPAAGARSPSYTRRRRRRLRRRAPPFPRPRPRAGPGRREGEPTTRGRWGGAVGAASVEEEAEEAEAGGTTTRRRGPGRPVTGPGGEGARPSRRASAGASAGAKAGASAAGEARKRARTAGGGGSLGGA